MSTPLSPVVLRASRIGLLVDSATFVLGVVIAAAGTWFTALALLFLELLRGLIYRPHSMDFPSTIGMFTSANVPAALLLLAVGWFLARRGARRLVSPQTSARIQAVLVRGLGAVLLLAAVLVAIAWFHDRPRLDPRVVAYWPYRFAVFLGIMSVSCLLGAYAQLLRPARIGPFLFGAAIVLGATVVYQYARLGADSMEAHLTSFNLGWACAITLLLTAPWRRLVAFLPQRRFVLGSAAPEES